MLSRHKKGYMCWDNVGLYSQNKLKEAFNGHVSPTVKIRIRFWYNSNLLSDSIFSWTNERHSSLWPAGSSIDVYCFLPFCVDQLLPGNLFNKMSELHEAAAAGDFDRVEELLRQNKCNPNQKDVDWSNKTPLHWAAAKGVFAFFTHICRSWVSFKLQLNTALFVPKKLLKWTIITSFYSLIPH